MIVFPISQAMSILIYRIKIVWELLPAYVQLIPEQKQRRHIRLSNFHKSWDAIIFRSNFGKLHQQKILSRFVGLKKSFLGVNVTLTCLTLKLYNPCTHHRNKQYVPIHHANSLLVGIFDHRKETSTGVRRVHALNLSYVYILWILTGNQSIITALARTGHILHYQLKSYIPFIWIEVSTIRIC